MALEYLSHDLYQENKTYKLKRSISKIKTPLHALQHTFLYIYLPLFCSTTTLNVLIYRRFMMEMPHEFPVHFFSLPLIFTLVTASISGISHFLAASLNLSCFLSTKFVSFVKVLRYSFSEAIPIFFSSIKSGFFLVRSL